ncbi:tRNA (N6-threonylcarbamoyladenosine(37)-N6)-methyltransferase TrmO [Psychrobium sp. 1_MG-2023]|uniref:tRNA (N6-threonylcarbamoyladenosine(37)-N6)-methyltransferase TrmO n=1 Tax=Psychrobium sp. 1_MG-2023 TaxID=3062624 RepID=UPI000C34D61E|nr:tRNA (N6-threonylcarbamoyladenosine(37)-N6)-methyltransferase TrmO [Psychrobium sp. 1_MG-2023]MDP2559974.1 tRNA (N6-threonylcarbamoyladenosine(37)-N6)-methyltransferase TrmO [Psychrobium sp. 1_MG-2023]PKF56437.1 tRNA (N6-threonylcarbamoyladenosine(37)-N6)-methyltransferase TrmO [Alteromonadales bacterium alter-6D02]
MTNSNLATTIEPIGIVHSPFKQKFGIPRQPSLASAVTAIIELQPNYDSPNMVRDLEQFSHLWLIFQFHQNITHGWKSLVRPPRLGGNKKTGVLATRSTFRPNGLGMSAVKLERVIIKNNRASIEVSGIDLLDGTPIFDIKPYIPYSDSLTQASGGYAQEPPTQLMQVQFSEQAQVTLAQQPNSEKLQALIEQILAQDPRPAYKKDSTDDKEYAIELYHYDIKWHVSNSLIIVSQIQTINQN